MLCQFTLLDRIIMPFIDQCDHRVCQGGSYHTGPEEGVYPVEEGQEVTLGGGRLRLPSPLDNCGPSLPNPPLPQGPHPMVEGRKALDQPSTPLHNVTRICEDAAGSCVRCRDIHMRRRSGTRTFCPANYWEQAEALGPRVMASWCRPTTKGSAV